MGRHKKAKVHFSSVKHLDDCILKVLVKLRKDNDLTQQELAIKLGMHIQAVSKIESKIFVPSLRVLRNYGIVFDLSISEILKQAEDMWNSV